MTSSMREIVVLDGGMGQELYRRSRRPASPIWSAQMLIDEPELVEAVHLDFIRAGAKVVTLNSYTLTPQRLARAGKTEIFDELHGAAVAAAKSARRRSGRKIRIAGSLPPLVASYRSDLVPDYDASLAAYRRIVSVQADHVDLFLCETLSTATEARAATLAASESGKAVWTTLTVDGADGTKLRSGEDLTYGAQAAIDAGARAVLVNCSIPEAVTEAMPRLADIGITFGAYANGFTSVEALVPGGTVDALEARVDLDPIAYADHALRWVGSGASIVGGCCEIGPAHIAELARRLTAEGYDIVTDVGP